MPDMPTNLDAKAAAALERAKQQANIPQFPMWVVLLFNLLQSSIRRIVM